MNVLRQISELRSLPGPLHLAIGVFDGVHPGHRKVIQTALEGAAENGGSAVVMTFDPHPVRVLCPERAPRLLASLTHKMRLLADIGVENVLVQTFDTAFASLSAEDFIARLVAAAQPLRQICVGRDWRFGAGRSGDYSMLKEAGAEYGFAVDAIESVTCASGEVISSTRIREAIQAGDFAAAREALGRDYTVVGVVVEGLRLGRTIGFPTANLRVFNEELPPVGVYAVEVRLDDGLVRHGVANLGFRPTVEGTDARLLLEVHLFDFDDDLYGREMEIWFRQFIRPEQKFDSFEALKAQIAEDATAARKHLRQA